MSSISRRRSGLISVIWGSPAVRGGFDTRILSGRRLSDTYPIRRIPRQRFTIHQCRCSRRHTVSRTSMVGFCPTQLLSLTTASHRCSAISLMERGDRAKRRLRLYGRASPIAIRCMPTTRSSSNRRVPSAFAGTLERERQWELCDPRNFQQACAYVALNKWFGVSSAREVTVDQIYFAVSNTHHLG